MTKKRNRTRANSEGSIIKLSGKRKKPFTARITVGWSPSGRQKFAYLGYYATKAEAKMALNHYLVSPYSLDKLTVQAIFDKWADKAKITDEVIKNYRNVVKNSGLADKIFKNVKLIELEDAASELTPSMQKRLKNAFKNLYDYGMRHDLIDKNLAALMELDDYSPKEKDIINKDDIKEILKGKDIIPKLMLYTGLRIGELLEIKSENVNIEERIMIGGKKTRAGKNRRIPIHKDIIQIIEDLLSNNTEYLISAVKGGKKHYVDYLTKEWHENDILTKYTTHQCRHTFISRCDKLELNFSVLQKVVGHSSSSVTTSVYTHIDNEQLIEFIDKFYY